MAEMTYRDAITAAMAEELRNDPAVFVLGEDARADLWATAGLFAEFGERIIDTPLSEIGFTGAAIGAAMTGMRPIVDMQIAQLLYNSFEQIANQASKARYMYNGQTSVPVVVRAAMGYGGSNAAHHSDRPYPMFMQLPGLKIVCPTTPADVKGLIKSAVRDNDPVIVFEDNNLMMLKGEVGGPEDLVPLGVGRLAAQGDDLTIVAIASAVPQALKAAGQLAELGITADVIDPRTLVPLDHEIILNSVRKTGRLVVADPANRTCGVAGEIAALVSETAFDHLRAPIRRITAPDMVVPFSPALEADFFPTAAKIYEAALSVVGHQKVEVAGAH